MIKIKILKDLFFESPYFKMINFIGNITGKKNQKSYIRLVLKVYKKYSL